MIKLKISKMSDGVVTRVINGEKHKFKVLPVTTRNDTLNKFIRNGELYGRVIPNKEPIHNFRPGDLVCILEAIPPRSKYISGKGIDCALSDWTGLQQNMYKTDVQLLKWEGKHEDQDKIEA